MLTPTHTLVDQSLCSYLNPCLVPHIPNCTLHVLSSQKQVWWFICISGCLPLLPPTERSCLNLVHPYDLLWLTEFSRTDAVLGSQPPCCKEALHPTKSWIMRGHEEREGPGRWEVLMDTVATFWAPLDVALVWPQFTGSRPTQLSPVNLIFMNIYCCWLKPLSVGAVINILKSYIMRIKKLWVCN